jgi:hypothetical protein
MGFYLYGGRMADVRREVRTLFFEEGASVNVLVTRHTDGTLSLRVNGKVDASNDRDMPTQLALA